MDKENDLNIPTDDSGGSGSAINPAWNDLLEVVPEDVHEQVIPHLQKWDKGVQERFTQVQSEWDQYKFLKENEISPEDTRIALGVLRAIQEDPESVYKALQENYGYGNNVNEEQDTGLDQGQEDLSNLPPAFMQEFERLKSGYETMAQILLEKQKQEEEQEQDKKLQAELASLRQQHGSFNEKFVLTEMLNGSSPEDAIKAWNDVVQEIKEQNARPPAPRLLGANSGGIPGEKRLDPTKLSSQETKNLVASYLKDMQRANQQ